MRKLSVMSNHNDEKFLKSKELERYLLKIINNVLTAKNLSLKIKLLIKYETINSTLALTDSKVILINTGHQLIDNFALLHTKFIFVIGLLGHELGHVLFTNFQLKEQFFEDIQNNIFDDKLLILNDDEKCYFDDFLSVYTHLGEKAKSTIIKIIRELHNYLEDPYVDTCMVSEFNNEFSMSIQLNNRKIMDDYPSIITLINKGYSKHYVLTAIVHQYCYTQNFNNLEQYSGEITEQFNKCKYIIENIQYEHDVLQRCYKAFHLFLYMWYWLKDDIQKIVETDEGNKNQANEELVKSITTLPNNSAIPIGTGTPALSPQNSSQTPNDNENKNNVQEIVSNHFNDILNELKRQENEYNLQMQLTNDAKQLNMGTIHNNISIKIKRPIEITDSMKKKYEIVQRDVMHISKNIVRQMQKHLKEREIYKKEKNLIIGKRIDPLRLYRNDDKFFYSNTIHLNDPELCIGMLIDQSGSMEGQKLKAATKTSVIIQELCDILKIPLSIYGHSTSGYDVCMDIYKDFRTTNLSDKYRLGDIKVGEANRDGVALNYMAHNLLTRKERNKLLILISDGLPYHNGYKGKVAEEDLKCIVKELEKKGITLFCAAIDENKDAIERIYGNRFLGISDLNKLPYEIVGLIKKYLI